MSPADKERRSSGNGAPAKEVAFDFIKASGFRVIHVDGAFGGVSPNARTMNVAVYSERRPLPRKTIHPISTEGKLGDEIRDRRESRDAFVREVEANLVMDLDTAKALREWLDAHITEMTKLHAQQGKKA
jgi:hypothetical protein